MKTEKKPDVPFPEPDVMLLMRKIGSLGELRGEDRKMGRRLKNRVKEHEAYIEIKEMGQCDKCGHFLTGFKVEAKENKTVMLRLSEEERQWLADNWLKKELKNDPPLDYEERLIDIAALLGDVFKRQVELAAGLIEEEPEKKADDGDKKKPK